MLPWMLRLPLVLAPALWLALGLVAGPAAASPRAYEVAAGLARLGPRPDGVRTQERAVVFLLEELRKAGLERVRAVPVPGSPGVVNVEGVVLGTGTGTGPGVGEIVLSVHYDSVRGSAGAGDDASGVGVAIAAAARLAEAPLRHTVRVVLFDAEETGLRGSRGWVGALAPAARDRILANINLEMVGWAESSGPTVHAIPVIGNRSMENGGERVTTPGWLIRALLASADETGWELHMSDPRYPIPMQLLLRGTRVRFGSDSNSFLEHGVPAVTLSDSSFFRLDPAYHRAEDTVERLDAGRLEEWTRVTVALVRRLDRLDGRPSAADDYLVLGGSVWGRWALAALGAVLAALVVWRRRTPSRWEFAFLLAAAAVLVPILALPLLAPAAVLALLPPSETRWRIGLRVFASVLPAVLYVLLLVGAYATRLSTWRGGYQESWLGVGLVLAALVLTERLHRPGRSAGAPAASR